MLKRETPLATSENSGAEGAGVGKGSVSSLKGLMDGLYPIQSRSARLRPPRYTARRGMDLAHIR